MKYDTFPNSLSLNEKKITQIIEKFISSWNKKLLLLMILFYGLGDILTTLGCQVLKITEHNVIYEMIFDYSTNILLNYYLFIVLKLFILFIIIIIYAGTNKNNYFLSVICLFGIYLTVNNFLNICIAIGIFSV